MTYSIETKVILTCDWCDFSICGNQFLKRGKEGWEHGAQPPDWQLDLCPECVKVCRDTENEFKIVQKTRQLNADYDRAVECLKAGVYREARNRVMKTKDKSE